MFQQTQIRQLCRPDNIQISKPACIYIRLRAPSIDKTSHDPAAARGSHAEDISLDRTCIPIIPPTGAKTAMHECSCQFLCCPQRAQEHEKSTDTS